MHRIVSCFCTRTKSTEAIIGSNCCAKGTRIAQHVNCPILQIGLSVSWLHFAGLKFITCSRSQLFIIRSAYSYWHLSPKGSSLFACVGRWLSALLRTRIHPRTQSSFDELSCFPLAKVYSNMDLNRSRTRKLI